MLLKLELCGLLTWERGIAHGRERDWRMLLVLGTFSKAPRPGRPPLEPGAQLCVCETGVAQSPLSPATSVTLDRLHPSLELNFLICKLGWGGSRVKMGELSRFLLILRV